MLGGFEIKFDKSKKSNSKVEPKPFKHVWTSIDGLNWTILNDNAFNLTKILHSFIYDE